MRIAVTTAVVLIALLFVWAVFKGGARNQAPPIPRTAPLVAPPAPPPPTPQPSSAPVATAPETTAPVTPATPTATPATAPQQTPPVTMPALAPSDADPIALESTLGSDDPKDSYDLQLKLSAWGASIEEISLAHYAESVEPNSPRYVVQSPLPVIDPADGKVHYLYPFAARSVTVNGQTVDLLAVRWRRVSPSQYQITLADAGKPVLRITRTYSVQKAPDAYQVLCRQQLENLGDKPLTIVWDQSLFVDMPSDVGSYIGDRRSLISGYYNPAYNPPRNIILTDNTRLPLKTVLDSKEPGHGLWPPKGQTGLDLVWLAEVNRFFAAAVYRPVPSDIGANPGLPSLDQLTEVYAHVDVEVVDAQPPAGVTLAPGAVYHAGRPFLTSEPLTLFPGQNTGSKLDLAFFAGPRDPALFDHEPYRALSFNELVIYELGCAFCTFQPLTHGLLYLLRFFHMIVRDWGLSIILLVLVIRVILHPITKKSQISVMKMGRQMSTLQPEIEKLKKKYENDQSKLNSEMMRLYKEKGINPANMLGCLPMFLQTPIWVALYAMLAYAIELRHQPAFFGVFQAVSGGKWMFLADLSSADNFITFSHGITVPLFFFNPVLHGINVLPILMAVFYYLQQALTMTPAATEQAAQQQKIGKWMTLMVPLFLYSAPSGLTLYMLASSAGGSIDSYIVRKHIREKEADGTLFTKAPAKEHKPGGLMDRIQKFIEEKQRQMLQGGGGGKNKR